MNDKQMTELIFNCLDKYYNQAERKFACIRELRCGTGYSQCNMRRVDYLAISTAAGNERYFFEVKASRADFLRDIKDEDKQKQARCFATHFYYVAPQGVVKDGELPAWAGLIQYVPPDKKDPSKGDYFIYLHTAPTLPQLPPTWGLVAALARHNQKSSYKHILDREKNRLRDEFRNKTNRIEWENCRLKMEIEAYKKGRIEK